MDIQTIRRQLMDRMGIKAVGEFVHAGSLRTFYLRSGNGSPLIFLHGAGGGGVTWGPVLNGFTGQRMVIAPDLPGYGESDKPAADYDRPFFCGWLMDFMNALNIPKADIVGSSQGGAVALEFALTHPERVNCLILADPAGFKPILLSPITMFDLFMTHVRPNSSTVRRLMRYLIYKPEKQPMKDVVAYFLSVLLSKNGRRAFLNGKGRAVKPIEKKRFRSLTIKTLIIWGAMDRLIPVSHGFAGVRLVPESRLRLIEDAGHAPFIDEPRKFGAIVASFINAEK